TRAVPRDDNGKTGTRGERTWRERHSGWPWRPWWWRLLEQEADGGRCATTALRQATETSLILLAREGDCAAFTELVRRRQGPVRALLRRLCGAPTLADDLAQQVFLKAWT